MPAARSEYAFGELTIGNKKPKEFLFSFQAVIELNIGILQNPSFFWKNQYWESAEPLLGGELNIGNQRIPFSFSEAVIIGRAIVASQNRFTCFAFSCSFPQLFASWVLAPLREPSSSVAVEM